MFRLRPATPADAASIALVWGAGWADGHLGNVPPALVDVRTPHWFSQAATERIANATVAEIGTGTGTDGAAGVVAGFVVVIDDCVDQVYVAARHRGSGVAAALLDAAEQQVAANGHDQAWLAVVPGNDRAIAFYRRRGWVDQGLFDHAAPGPDGPIPTQCHRYTKALTGHR
ncbi:GNAT family N-acetyltransferase [Nocardioides sp. AE5]|uniref:GNAT family N-acetyltransferase n=1 Tax=Nocardioides sp. AE5 TaxID=2962573 RepID=UPI002881C9D0|nr:GNAT family N-acetyltransferase [Nocardioides sp. AE5]MDT0202968.1 GNAT family N-acetyltransferase [Nocardioides sp. AE5]